MKVKSRSMKIRVVFKIGYCRDYFDEVYHFCRLKNRPH